MGQYWNLRFKAKPRITFQVLNEMKETGYEGTELGDWGFMPANPKQLRMELGEKKT